MGLAEGNLYSKRTLIIKVQLLHDLRLCLIILEIFSQLLVVCDCSVQRLASRECLPQFRPFLRDLCIAKQQRPSVEVVTPLSILSPLLRSSCQQWQKTGQADQRWRNSQSFSSGYQYETGKWWP